MMDVVISYYGNRVRRVRRGLKLVVQQLVNGEWVDHKSFHEMADDYASSNSIMAASMLQQKLQWN